MKKAHRLNGIGITGFILALLTNVFFWNTLTWFIIWFIGLAFSFVGLFKKPRAIAIVGLVLSIIDILLLNFFSSIFIGL